MVTVLEVLAIIAIMLFIGLLYLIHDRVFVKKEGILIGKPASKLSEQQQKKIGGGDS
jgi:hypothetical protein